MTNADPPDITDAASANEPPPAVEAREPAEEVHSGEEEQHDTTASGGFADSVHDIVTLNFLRQPAVRETLEFAAMLVILWMLLRGFEVEPFVIPTGSMAPTLQGRHHEVECPECKYWYRTGSSEQTMPNVGKGTCPLCRYRLELDKENEPNHRVFSGDRILVSKFAYDFADPQRWDVAVFKFPRHPSTNYIKRLVGLPGETIRIQHGDIYFLTKEDKAQLTEQDRLAGREKFRIARKPPQKLVAMLQIVDDTNHIPETLIDVNWPSRWQSWASGQPLSEASWSQDSPSQFSVSNSSERVQWLRYRHLVPGPHSGENDWDVVLRGELPRNIDGRGGQLIADYYAYNDAVANSARLNDWSDPKKLGMHWVGDLAIECEVTIRGDVGTVWLDLVEGGVHYRCAVDIASGRAEFSIDDANEAAWGDDGVVGGNPSATTSLRGAGDYHLRFSNVDNELRLWIDNKLVAIDGRYTRDAEEVIPKCNWRVDGAKLGDPLDLAPAGIGASNGATLMTTRLRVLRDIYYTATEYERDLHEYDIHRNNAHQVREILCDHHLWKGGLFKSRQQLTFEVGDEEYFPLGDNSPSSKDARVWSDRLVHRDLLTGKAVFIYWPHTWNAPIPFMPNFRRMGFIR